MWDDQIKELITAKENNKSYKKWLAAKKLDNKIEYKETEH